MPLALMFGPFEPASENTGAQVPGFGPITIRAIGTTPKPAFGTVCAGECDDMQPDDEMEVMTFSAPWKTAGAGSAGKGARYGTPVKRAFEFEKDPDITKVRLSLELGRETSDLTARDLTDGLPKVADITFGSRTVGLHRVPETYNRRSTMRRILIAITAIALTGVAHADDMQATLKEFGINPNASYSGMRHVESKEGQMDMFVRQAPKMSRIDMNMQSQSVSLITREDRGVNYMLMPQMSMYKEVAADQVQVAGANLSFSEVSEVGAENINGYDCTKYRAKFKDAQGGKAGGYYWVSDDGILMKVDMIYKSRKQKGERMIFEMRDLEVGPQDPSYFEVPSSYSSMGFSMARGPSAPIPMEDGESPQYTGYEDPTLGEEIGDMAEEETEQAVKDESRKSIRKSLKKLFD